MYECNECNELSISLARHAAWCLSRPTLVSQLLERLIFLMHELRKSDTMRHDVTCLLKCATSLCHCFFSQSNQMDSRCSLIDVLWSLELTSYLCAAILELLGTSPKTGPHKAATGIPIFLSSSSSLVCHSSQLPSKCWEKEQIKCALCIWHRSLLH